MSEYHTAVAEVLHFRYTSMSLVWFLILLSLPWCSAAYTYQIGAGSPIKHVPFRVYISGGIAVRAGIIRSQTTCSGLQAAGGSYIPLDTVNSAWFTLTEIGSNSVCIIDGSGDTQWAGSITITEITFTPSHIFRAQPATLTFQGSITGASSVIVSSRSSCDSNFIVYGPLNLVNLESQLTPQTTSSGFVCVLWPGGNPITTSVDLWVSAGELTVSEPFQFFPETVLRNDQATIEINTAGFAKNSRAAISSSYSCSNFIIQPVAMNGHRVTLFMRTGVAGNYYLCVEVPLNSGFYVSAAGTITVEAYTFSPRTIIAGLTETITLGGAVNSPNTLVTIHQTADCNSASIGGPLQSNNYIVNNVVVPTAGTVWVCIRKPLPDTDFILSDSLTVEPLYTIDTAASSTAVLGITGTIVLSGGSPSNARTKLVSTTQQCTASVVGLLSETAVDSTVTYTYLLPDITDYKICVETTDQSRWISAGVISVQGYTLTTISLMIIEGRDSIFKFDESTPTDGVNISFAYRQPFVTNACSTISSNNDVILDYTTYPSSSMIVEFPKDGVWDMCLGPSNSFLIGTVTVVAELTFLPRQGIQNTPTVLLFGSSVPTDSDGVLLSSDVVGDNDINCEDGNIPFTVLSNRTAALELNETLLPAGVYYFCVATGASSSMISFSKNENLTIQSDSTLTYDVVANVTRQLQLKSWSLTHQVFYTTNDPPIETSRSHRYRMFAIPTDIHNKTDTIFTCPNNGYRTTTTNYVEIDSGLTSLQQSVDIFIDYVPESRLLVVCVAISISPYLFQEGDLFWTPVAYLNISDPIIVIEPTPSPSDVTANGLTAIVVGIPYTILLSGSVQPGTSIKLSEDSTCLDSVPGGSIRELGPTMEVTFVLQQSGIFKLCVLGTSLQWIGVRDYEVEDITINPRELYFENPEYRQLMVSLIRYAEVDITSMHFSSSSRCENENLIGSDMKAFDYEPEIITSRSIPPGSGYINAILPPTARDLPLVTICGRQSQVSTTGSDFYPVIVSTIINSRRPVVTQHSSLRRKSPWKISISGSNVVGTVLLKLGSCADDSPFVDGGAARTFTRGAVVTFVVDLPVGGMLVLCGTANTNDPTYFVNLGSYQVASFFQPTTLLADRTEEITFAANTDITGTVSDSSFAVLMNSESCNLTLADYVEGPFWMQPESVAQPSPVTVLLLSRSSRLVSNPVYVCVGFTVASASRSHQSLSVDREVTTQSVLPGISDEINLSEVGIINVIKDQFRVKVSPDVINAGQPFTVQLHTSSIQHAGRLVKLSNSSSCSVDIHNPQPLTSTSSVVFTMNEIDQRSYSGLLTPTICVNTPDASNWIPAIPDGDPGYLQLSYTFPVRQILGSISPLYQTIEDIEVGWGLLQFSYSDAFCNPVAASFPIVNHTAEVTILTTRFPFLWVCYDNIPAGRVTVTPPPKLQTSYYPITSGVPVVLTAVHTDYMSQEFLLRIGSASSQPVDNSHQLEVTEAGRVAVFAEFSSAYPGLVFPLGEITVWPFLSADQQPLVSDRLQDIAIPNLIGVTWTITLKLIGSDCSISNANETIWSDNKQHSSSVTVMVTAFVDEVVVCANGADVGTISVIHIWDFSITPTYAVHNYSSTVSLLGNKSIPVESRVLLIRQDTMNPLMTCDNYASRIDDGSAGWEVLSMTQKNGLFNTPETPTDGNYTVCVEVVTDSGIYHKVSSPISFHQISVQNQSALQACKDSYWTLSISNVPYEYSISMLQAYMIVGSPMLGQCCTSRSDFTMMNMTLSPAQGISTFTAEYYFEEAMLNPVLVCLRIQEDYCYELQGIQSGVSDCVVIPNTPLPDRRIGGAIDPTESENVSEGAIIGLVVAIAILIILCLVCVWRFVVPKFNEKPKPDKLIPKPNQLRATTSHQNGKSRESLNGTGIHSNGGKSTGLVSRPVAAFADSHQNVTHNTTYTSRGSSPYVPLQRERVAMLGSVTVDVPNVSSYLNGNDHSLGVHNTGSNFLSAPRQLGIAGSPPHSVMSSHRNAFQPLMNGAPSTYSGIGYNSPRIDSDNNLLTPIHNQGKYHSSNSGLQSMLTVSPAQVSSFQAMDASRAVTAPTGLRNPLHVTEASHYIVPPPIVRPQTAPDPSIISATSTQQPTPQMYNSIPSSPFRVTEGDLIGRTPAEIDALLRRWQGIQQSERLECETLEDVARNQFNAEEDSDRREMKEHLDHQVRVVEVDRRKSKAREETNQQEMAKALKQAQKLQEKKERAEKAQREEEKLAKEEERVRKEADDKVKQQDAELEEKRAAVEEEERKTTQKRIQREREMRARLEAEETRNERVETAGALNRHEKDKGLTFHRLLQQTQREEKKERDIINGEFKSTRASTSHLFETDTNAMKAFLAKLTHESREREKAEISQRDSLFSFEEDSRNTVGSSEQSDWQTISNSATYELSKKQQINELLRQQKELEKERAAEREQRERFVIYSTSVSHELFELMYITFIFVSEIKITNTANENNDVSCSTKTNVLLNKTK